MPATVIFTDLDGTLLDSATYSFAAAQEALTALRTQAIPLIVVSSKTRAEILPIRRRLLNTHPFIVENGGAVVIPTDYFPFPLAGTVLRDGCDVVELGTPYPRLRAALKDIQGAIGRELRGYGDMSVDEIVTRTGLSREEAELSKQREYDEPFVVECPAIPEDDLAEAVKAHGLQYTKGDRFFHLMGPHDKGRAVRYLIECYGRQTDRTCDRLRSVGIGNSLNDLPMLEAVTHPILVQLADGSYEPGIELPRLIRAPGPGPIGWNRAVLSLLQVN